MARPLLYRSLFYIGLIVACVALYQLAARFPLQRDFTQNQLNSLEEGSVYILAQLDQPLEITVYATEQDARQGDVRKLVSDFIALYQRYKPDIKLTFVDPLKEPESIRKSGIRGNGEMVVVYDGRREHLTTLNEQTLTSALMRLARNREQWVMYVTGHGERKLDGKANHDLGEFGRRLTQNGYRIAPLNLTVAQEVPDNISLLVITQPQHKLLKGESAKLLRFVKRGGNLLWLLDAEPLRGLESLAEQLHIDPLPGMIIDPAAQQMNAPRDWTLGSGYPPHPVTRDFDLITAFPYASALSADDSEDWTRQTLVEGAGNGWVSQRRDMRFDAAQDVPGPFSLALALQRSGPEHEQRVVVVGSGAFLSNAYSGNGGNLDLGMNMVNWLAGDEQFITLAPHTAKDGTVTLSKHQLTAFTYSLLLALPLLMIAIGGWLWWRRHHAA
ncbi:MAG: GldG family protein [Sideroxydans sp.]|nr:GldG family protein [Sideroxydans sp.]